MKDIELLKKREQENKHYRDDPNMMDPNMKCHIRESEIRLDLEERIRKAENGMELATLVQAWCEVTKKKNIVGIMQSEQCKEETKIEIRETMVNFLMFVLGEVIAIVLLMLLTRL